jgi:hypothetical protein
MQLDKTLLCLVHNAIIAAKVQLFFLKQSLFQFLLLYLAVNFFLLDEKTHKVTPSRQKKE